MDDRGWRPRTQAHPTNRETARKNPRIKKPRLKGGYPTGEKASNNTLLRCNTHLSETVFLMRARRRQVARKIRAQSSRFSVLLRVQSPRFSVPSICVRKTIL